MKRLLVVDDEWLIRKGIVRTVERLRSGWSIEEAANGREAIERIGRCSFDLIFCDIKMPEMDGITMLDEMTRRCSRVPVVFLTGYDDFPLMQSAIRLRAYDYLLKPVHDSDIVSVFASFEQDFGTVRTRSGAAHAEWRKFEFRLISALETFDADRVASVLEDGRSFLDGGMAMTEYVDEIVRIASHFFSKYRVYGFARDVRFSSNDLSNFANVLHAIRIRLAQVKEAEEAGKSGNKIIRLAKDYINSHLQRPLTLAEVADYVHFNPTYFSEYFKEKSGETFMGYVTRMKLEKAKEMLADPAIRINDISDCLGYKDPRSFTKMFKTTLGLTPTEYRNRHT